MTKSPGRIAYEAYRAQEIAICPLLDGGVDKIIHSWDSRSAGEKACWEAVATAVFAEARRDFYEGHESWCERGECDCGEQRRREERAATEKQQNTY